MIPGRGRSVYISEIVRLPCRYLKVLDPNDPDIDVLSRINIHNAILFQVPVFAYLSPNFQVKAVFHPILHFASINIPA